MKNMFMENYTKKYGGEASHTPYYKKLKLIISMDQQSLTYIVSFINDRIIHK